MAEASAFKIYFEDQHLIVLEKPAGVLSQSDESGAVSMVDLLRVHFGRNFVGVVHRLDRNTSGLMVYAKRSKAADRLTQALQSGKLRRKYHAICEGTVPLEFEWEDYLYKDENSNRVRVIKDVTKTTLKAQKAKLKGRRLELKVIKGESLSLMELELETGRSHQIRVQSSSRGFPLVGDAKYGGHTVGTLNRPALHSIFLEFPHPMESTRRLSYASGMSEDMLKLWGSR